MGQSNRVVALAVFCFMICLSVSVFAEVAETEVSKGILESTEIEITADTSYFSKYLWRGFKLDGDPVMQTGIYLSGYGLDASIWGSTDVDSDDDLTTSEEVDYSIGYTYSLKDTPLSLTGRFIYYDFPASDGASREFYFGVGLDAALSPAITWYQDIGDEDSGGSSGDYVVLDLSHSVSLDDDVPISLDLSGHVGYNRELGINGDNGGDVGLGAALTVQLSEKCSFSPSINYAIPFGDLSDTDDGNYETEFYTGATLAYSF